MPAFNNRHRRSRSCRSRRIVVGLLARRLVDSQICGIAGEALVDTQVEQSPRIALSRPERASRLLAHVERRANLEARTISQMYDLYATYYDATSPSLFEQDLDD